MKNKLMPRDVVDQRPSKFRRIKTVYGFFFPRAMSMLRETARKTGAFSEQANCNRVIVMSKRKGDQGCALRHTRSPGLMPTRRRSVERPGAIATSGGEALTARTYL